MSYTGDEDHSIDMNTASEWTKNYRDSLTLEPGDPTIGFLYGKTAIQEILSQEGCFGLRIYQAIDQHGKKQMIITGVNGEGDDIYQGLLCDRGGKCPPGGGATNPLNS